ncbi:MAG: transaldolase [Clostridium sp.]|uniref:transaldolase n=1 Tax=Clostridium sp. TaxID=1506 RepID=UPI003D6CC5F2
MIKKDLNVKIFADGAVLKDMMEADSNKVIKGFTTNPSLMKKAGITSYETFARDVLKNIKEKPISFEVFSDEFEMMEKEAKKIGSLGKNVYIKIPITNSRGESSIPLVKRLSEQGLSLNVTAILTIKQVEETVEALAPETTNIVSVFAGRMADSGINPIPYMKQAAEICHSKKGTELLWASSREVLNIFQADECECDIITVTNDLLNKFMKVGRSLEDISLDTVKMFNNDIKTLGYSIL